MSYPGVFLAYPAAMLQSLQPKTLGLPVLMPSDRVRSGLFITDQFPFKYDQYCSTGSRGVLSGYWTTTGWQVLPGQKGSVYSKTWTRQDGFKVGGARVRIKNHGRSVK